MFTWFFLNNQSHLGNTTKVLEHIRILFYDTEKRYIYILNLTRLVISIHTVFKAILTVLIHQINVYFKNTTSIQENELFKCKVLSLNGVLVLVFVFITVITFLMKLIQAFYI